MIAVLTYNFPHRKTQDLCFRLKLVGHNFVKIYALPWETRQNFKPLYPHRPEPLEFMPSRLADILGYEFAKITNPQEVCGDKILIGGAGVIPTKGMPPVINSHPGYLPHNRGLDALKWAILEGNPIGVTTYEIGTECDTGVLIDHKYTPRKPLDDFYSLAMRHYDLEIDMLVDALDRKPQRMVLGTELSEVHRRMPHELEVAMMHKFKCKPI